MERRNIKSGDMVVIDRKKVNEWVDFLCEELPTKDNLYRASISEIIRNVQMLNEKLVYIVEQVDLFSLKLMSVQYIYPKNIFVLYDEGENQNFENWEEE